MSRIGNMHIQIPETVNISLGTGIVEIKDGEVIALYNEVPEGAKMVK